MSRGLTADQLAAVAAKNVRPAFFVLLDFASAATRVWSGIGNFVWGGNTYTGVGTLGAISEIEETNTPVANGVTLTLNGIPSELIAQALDRTDYRGRKVRIWQGWFVVESDTQTLIGDPVPVFAGRMDTMTPSDDGTTSSISLQCENRLVDLQRPRELRRTDEDQRRKYPTDGSFRFIVGIQGKEFNWGQKAS